MVKNALAGDGGFEIVSARLAEESQIARAHDPAYVRGFLEGSLDPRIVRQIGFPWSEGLVRRTLASVGGSLAAAEDAWRTGFGGNLAGGTHHAWYAEGAGFCVFNDLAICIREMRHLGRIGRASVIDLDVHQGDGTAAIFADDAEVFTFSMHGRNNYPLRKQRSTLDIDLPDGTGDGEYLRILAEALPEVFAFAPDAVFFQTGVDGLASDRLGRLSLTHDGLRQRDRLVMEAARNRGIPLVVTLGGGYAEPIRGTVEAHANTFRTAKEIFAPPEFTSR